MVWELFFSGENFMRIVFVRARQFIPLIVLGFTITLVADGIASADTPAPPARSVVYHKQMIPDPTMQTDAYSVLVPDGWKLESSITWDQIKPVPYVTIAETNADLHATWKHYPRGFYVDGVRENYSRLFPAKKAEIEQALAEGKQTQLGETVYKLPATPREFLERIFIPANFPEIAADKNAKVTDEKDMPDIAKIDTEHDPLHRPAKVGMVRFAYSTPNGPMETQFIAMMAISDMRTPNGRPNFGPNFFYVTETNARTAPAGKLDALLPTFNAIDSSLTQQLPWFNLQIKIGQAFLQKQQQMWAQMLQNQRDQIAAQNQMLQNQRDAINQRQQIMHDAAQQQSNNVSDQIRQNFADQQAGKADSQEQFMHYITDSNKYKDPNDGSMVTLPSNKYLYEDNHGDIIGTDDPTYHPPIDPSTSWQPMEKVN
jgi:hypothetical protein